MKRLGGSGTTMALEIHEIALRLHVADGTGLPGGSGSPGESGNSGEMSAKAREALVADCVRSVLHALKEAGER